MASICIIHEEETGEQRPAPHRFSRYVGDGRYQTDPVCEECYRELCSAAGAERHNATLYAYASGERA